MSRLLVVDGHAYAYRAFYAIRSLRMPDGRPSNAIYGFVKMLGKIRAALRPSHALVAWDGGLSPERQQTLPGYKAQRPEMPEDLQGQLDEITRYLEAVGVASYCETDVEADDYIARVVREGGRRGVDAVIASSDKDFMQLVGPGVGLLNPNDKTETIWSSQQVEAKTGVRPEQIVDWLSLTGDSVDNIPGAPGIGPKTATGLLQQFQSVDELYRRIAEVQPRRVREGLQAAEAEVRRNQRLVRLNPEVGQPVDWEALREKAADRGKLAELYREWGFRSLLAELLKAGPAQPELI
ncbi:MAG TPA: 5'-3' exonuclease H3TH domain-containing protein [Verrucomicrobiota bacterium]|nr:5'-3' exonuclease H3TH domain-containing protein [Verrucomicrobiota bacterium]HNT15040.1 5'-3' exonuclease H3TH domain-containing protein [Verrucomicrobiota bacterium]